MQLPDKLAPQRRALSVRADVSTVDTAARTVALSFSSEAPVDMWYGTEILSHDKGAVRLDRIRNSAPLLFNHDMDDLLGVVESVDIGNDKRGHALVRFGKDERGEWAMQQVADGILANVSFMYRVYKFEEDLEEETVTATDWEPFEISLVTVPADPSVGVGRAAPGAENPVTVSRKAPAAEIANPVPTGTNEGATMAKRHILQDQATDGTGDRSTGGAVATAAPPAAPAADITAARSAGADTERERTAEIVALGRRHSLSMDQVHDMIQRKITIAEARGEVLELVSNRGQKPVASLGHNNVDLTEKEKRAYSFFRAIQGTLSGNWEKAGFEREVSIEIAKASGKTPQNDRSFFVPTNLPFCPSEEHARAWMMEGGGANYLKKRAIYQVGTANQGGNMVATNLLADSFIEVLRNTAVTTQLGARLLTGLVGNVDIPSQTAQTSTYWVAESGAPTEAEATWGKVSLRPKTIGALSKMSRLMLLQSTPAIEMLAREDLLAVMALGIDLAALSGSGSGNQPTGIVNQAGVGSVVGGTNGANLSFDHIIQAYSAPRIANAPQSNLGFAINAKSYGYLSTQKSTTGQYLWMPEGGITQAPGDTLRGYAYAVSNQLRSNLTKGTSSGICSELIFGNWRELLIGEWGTTEIMVNPYDATGFTQGDVLIRAFQTIDIGVRHAASFAVMSDALTPGF